MQGMRRIAALTLALALGGLPCGAFGPSAALAAGREDNRPRMFQKSPPAPPPKYEPTQPPQLPQRQTRPREDSDQKPASMRPAQPPSQTPAAPPRRTLEGQGCCRGGRAVGCRAGKVLCADGSLSSTCSCPRQDTRP